MKSTRPVPGAAPAQAARFQTISERDLSLGIDARSAENLIQPGFIKDGVNVDVVEGRIRTRKGYQGHAGNLPVRIASLQNYASSTSMTLTLPSSVDLSTIRSSPIILSGLSSSISANSAITTTSSTHYYAGFTPLVSQAVSAGSNSLSVLGTTHGLGTYDLAVEVAQSTSLTDKSSVISIPDSIVINKSSYDISVGVTVPSATSEYIYYKGESTASSGNYIVTWSHGGTGLETSTTTSGTHGLANYNIQVTCLLDSGSGTVSKIIPDAVTITTSGTVAVSANLSSAATIYIVLHSCPSTQLTSFSAIGSGTTSSVTVSGVTSPYITYSCYREQTPGGTVELIIPDSISYSASTNSFTVSVTNPDTSATVYVYWEYCTLKTNQISITDSAITADATDSSPQLTLWGLDHSEIYGTNRAAGQGWVTHLDTFRRAAESRVVAGLGGNLFTARTYAESGSTYNYGLLYPSLQSRTSGSLILAPTFWLTGSSPARTRGYITSDSISSGFATVTAVNYDSGTGWTKYTVSLPGKLILDNTGTPTSLSSVISTTTGLEDWFTVSQMSHASHNGTMKIRQVTDGTNQILIYVENSAITSSDYDDTGTVGVGGILTDQISWDAGTSMIPGDVLAGPTVGTNIYTVMSSSGSTSVISGMSGTLSIATGTLYPATRSSSVIPLRTSIPSKSSSVSNLVRGDMLSYTGISRLVRVLYINADTADRTVNITTNSVDTATVTLQSGSTTSLSVGMNILLLGAGVYTGVQTITAIPSLTTFQFSTSLSTSVSGATLVHNTVHIDESLSWTDSISDANYLQVVSRWIPVEAPTSSSDLVKTTHYRYLNSLEYESQNIVRSTMVSNNLYVTNNSDTVMKFDGSSLTRAGLVPWQPGLMISVDPSATGKIVVPSPTATPSALSANIFTVTAGLESNFPIGSQLRYISATGATPVLLQVLKTSQDQAGTNGYIQVQILDNNTSIPAIGSGTSLTGIARYKYYYRLNMTDINNNVITSAVAQSDDTVVYLAENAAVRHHIVGLPVLDNYDYARINVSIYRTMSNQEAPFYKVGEINIPFNKYVGYIDYIDSYSDINLVELDSVMTALKGAELGTNLSDPLRAKYITSIGNRLVLGNLTGYPELDIQLSAPASVANSAFNGSIWTLRTDSTSSSTTTDMITTARYQMTTSSTGTVKSITAGSNQFTITVASTPAGVGVASWVYLSYAKTSRPSLVTSAASGSWTSSSGLNAAITGHGFVEGDQVQFTTTGALPTGLTAGTTYYIKYVDANNLHFATTYGGTAIAYTDAGSGTHTITLQGNNLTYSGWWQVASYTGTTMVVNLTGAATASAVPDTYTVATTCTDIPVLLGTDGNYSMFNGNTVALYDNTRRLAMAINASMRMTDITLTGQSTFTPWVMARSGNDVAKAGRIIISAPSMLTTTLGMKTPAAITGADIYVNGVKTTASTAVASRTLIYPSRILVSYENYPEVMDNPTAVTDSLSDSAIDINSADGQQITGIIPFFGESAYGAALKSSILVVFKTNSIYLVDLNEKLAGKNPLQRIETEGLGCTLPYSIATTKGGIMFCNESGIYMLKQDQTIRYIGRYMERLWTEQTSFNNLLTPVGHHDNIGRSYKISVPSVGASENSQVYVYNHTAEDFLGILTQYQNRYGAWTRYNNHQVTGWANLGSDEFWSSTTGRVMRRRNVGDQTDYRDDHSAVSSTLDIRALDFGDAGIRKILDRIVIHYRTGARNTGTTVQTSVDTNQEYRSTTTPIIIHPGATTMLSDPIPSDIITVLHETDRRKGVYHQIRIQCAAVDQNIEIAGIDLRVAGLNARGITTAQATRSK